MGLEFSDEKSQNRSKKENSTEGSIPSNETLSSFSVPEGEVIHSIRSSHIEKASLLETFQKAHAQDFSSATTSTSSKPEAEPATDEPAPLDPVAIWW